ncbi:MAG: hypothetical protein QS721_03800 [Candidatus Endonucleobacter sp. (ex Gigantidas childressi)]|nr:hypothetical protein [Candidatus Endonucleobacter sp. (ex Gigantidas childressi)]
MMAFICYELLIFNIIYSDVVLVKREYVMNISNCSAASFIDPNDVDPVQAEKKSTEVESNVLPLPLSHHCRRVVV